MFEPICELDCESLVTQNNVGTNLAPETICDKGLTLAVIIWHDFCKDGIHFVTPDHLPQQVAYMRHPAGKQIQPHIHHPITRHVNHSQEVLFIKKGKLRVDFYTEDQKYYGNRVLTSGDVIVLINGGHGFTVLEEVEMIEVKQGPYVGDHERIQFPKSSPELFVVPN